MLGHNIVMIYSYGLALGVHSLLEPRPRGALIAKRMYSQKGVHKRGIKGRFTLWTKKSSQAVVRALIGY